MMVRDIQLVIFDLDGTLVDAYAAVASSVNHMLVALGRAPVDDEKIKRSVGWGVGRLIETFVAPDEVERALSVYRDHHVEALRSGTKWLPGARELVWELKGRGLTLAIASNRATRFTHIILRHLEAESMFAHVVCADRVGNPKPSGEMLTRILAASRRAPEEALYVGDMTIDIETGLDAGVPTVAVATGSNTREELALLEPLAVIDCVADVAGFVGTMDNPGHVPGVVQGGPAH